MKEPERRYPLRDDGAMLNGQSVGIRPDEYQTVTSVLHPDRPDA